MIISYDYLNTINNYVDLFKNFKLPYDLLIVNDGIFKTNNSIFNFSPDIVRGKYEIINTYNTGNIHYYWTQLNSDIEKYRTTPRKGTIRKGTTARATRTTRTKRKSHSSLSKSTDFNILKKIINKLKPNDQLLNQFTNDDDKQIAKYTFPKFITSQIRVLDSITARKSVFSLMSSFVSTEPNNNLLSSNSENSSSENSSRGSRVSRVSRSSRGSRGSRGIRGIRGSRVSRSSRGIRGSRSSRGKIINL